LRTAGVHATLGEEPISWLKAGFGREVEIMPNGRHGAVLIPRDDLRQFFDSIQGNPVLGKFEGADILLSDVKRMVKSHAEGEVFVEGQWLDPGTAVVIHLHNASRLLPLPPGSFYTEPPGEDHFAETRDSDVLVQISGVGPTGTTYVRAADDPRH